MDKRKAFKDIIENMYKIYLDKNEDYGDSFALSFNKLGIIAGLLPIYNKMNRLINLVDKKRKVKDESIEDTLLDLANYCVLTLLELKNKEKKEIKFTEDEEIYIDNLIDYFNTSIDEEFDLINYKSPNKLSKKDGDIGYDLRAIGVDNQEGIEMAGEKDGRIIKPNECVRVHTGLYMEFPKNVYAVVFPRSGLSSKNIDCKMGLVDTNYRGEICMSIANNSGKDYLIEDNGRMGQLVIHSKGEYKLNKVISIDNNTNRGKSGFGSTGTR